MTLDEDSGIDPAQVDGLREDIQAFSRSVTTLAGTLGTSVTDLTDRLNAANAQSRRMRRFMVGLVISVAFDIALSAGLVFQGVRLSDVQGRIAAVQEITSDQVLCPLYGLIVSGYHPELRAVGPQRDEYIHDYKVILDGYAALHCVPVSGAVPGPTGTPSR